MSVDSSLADVRALLADGLLDQAVRLTKARDTRAVHDHDLHLAWADVAEEMGLADDVILELNLAIRDNPDRLEIYPRLAEVLLDQGQPARAVKVWTALVERQPENPRNYEGLGEALKEAGDFEKAREAYAVGLERTGEARFKNLIRDMGFLDAEAEPSEQPHDAVAIVPQQHQLVTYTNLFSGREGVYARQWISPTGESGYTPVEEPFTMKVAENHILGNFTIGVYPVRLDNTVNFIAFDFDAAKFAISRCISSERAWAGLMAKVHQASCRLMDVAASHDIPLYLEDSGFKGRHAWIFLDVPIQAGVARKFGEVLVRQIMPLAPEVSVEVFPKQTSVRRGGLGNLIKLPLGIHKRTGKRGLFIDPNGQACPDQLGTLETVTKAPRRSIFGLIQRLHTGLQAVSPATGEDTAPLDATEPEAEPQLKTESLPPQPAFDLDRDPQFQYLVLKCPAVRSIVEKVNRTGMLSKEETLVLIHTLGHLDRGPDAVNEIFRRCINADPSLFLKSRLKGHPMSCGKIRSRIPEITSTVECNCTFDLGVNLYPTPIIHVQGMSERIAVSPLGLTVDSLQFQNLLQDYLKLRRQFRETQLLMGRYEKRLEEFFRDAGVDSLQTPSGTLHMTKTESGVAFVLDV